MSVKHSVDLLEDGFEEVSVNGVKQVLDIAAVQTRIGKIGIANQTDNPESPEAFLLAVGDYMVELGYQPPFSLRLMGRFVDAINERAEELKKNGGTANSTSPASPDSSLASAIPGN